MFRAPATPSYSDVFEIEVIDERPGAAVLGAKGQRGAGIVVVVDADERGQLDASRLPAAVEVVECSDFSAAGHAP